MGCCSSVTRIRRLQPKLVARELWLLLLSPSALRRGNGDAGGLLPLGRRRSWMWHYSRCNPLDAGGNFHWQWAPTCGDIDQQTKGALASLLLMPATRRLRFIELSAMAQLALPLRVDGASASLPRSLSPGSNTLATFLPL